MRKKWPLFLGILLLTAGIIFRTTTDYSFLGLTLIKTGVAFKAYYIIDKIFKGEYKVGLEMLCLLFGLILFFTGLYFKKTGADFNPYFLMAPGIGLKVVFIGIFIRKTKKVKS